MIHLLRLSVLTFGLLVVFTMNSTNTIVQYIFTVALGGSITSTFLYIGYLTGNSEIKP